MEISKGISYQQFVKDKNVEQEGKENTCENASRSFLCEIQMSGHLINKNEIRESKKIRPSYMI